MNEEIHANVIKVLSKYSELPEVDILATTGLRALGIDSMALVEILFDLEEQFDIEITLPDNAVNIYTSLKTVGDVSAVVERILSEKVT